MRADGWYAMSFWVRRQTPKAVNLKVTFKASDVETISIAAVNNFLNSTTGIARDNWTYCFIDLDQAGVAPEAVIYFIMLQTGTVSNGSVFIDEWYFHKKPAVG